VLKLDPGEHQPLTKGMVGGEPSALEPKTFKFRGANDLFILKVKLFVFLSLVAVVWHSFCVRQDPTILPPHRLSGLVLFYLLKEDRKKTSRLID